MLVSASSRVLDRVAELDERITDRPPTTIAGAVAALALAESEAETHGQSPLVVPLVRGARAFVAGAFSDVQAT